MAGNRRCVTCLRGYSYCPGCARDADKPRWMFAFCSERCRRIDGILSAHTAGRLGDGAARGMLLEIEGAAEALAGSALNRKHFEEIMGRGEARPDRGGKEKRGAAQRTDG